MLEERITEDYKQAMKSKDAVKSSALSFLRSQIKYMVIEKKVSRLEDADTIAVIKKQVKQHQDSIDQFEKGNRNDLADKEKIELAILKSYLPQEMSESELRVLIDAAVKESGASTMKDMGKVMKVLMSKVAGKADNKLVSDLVKKVLSGA